MTGYPQGGPLQIGKLSRQTKYGGGKQVMIFERAGSTRALKNHYLYRTTNKINCAFQFAETLAIQAFSNFAIYNCQPH